VEVTVVFVVVVRYVAAGSVVVVLGVELSVALK
jgi:hypothetical protein